MSRHTNPDVLIVGGGLAGLGLAAYLHRQGLSPTIVEQVSEWRKSGYGIGLWDDGLGVLAELGLLAEARKQAADPHSFEVRTGQGEVLTRVSLPPEQTLLLAIHRNDLHAVLRDEVPAEWIRMGTSPSTIEEREDGVDVTFEDGTTEMFDLVVGADGVHSTVRDLCFQDWTLREFDTYIWSLWADQTQELGPDMVSLWGEGTEGFLAQVDNRVVFNLAARLPTPPEGSPGEALRSQAEVLGWQLPALLDRTDETPFFDRVRDVSCERWHTDRVVLIGDAAHAVHPISGMGASLALRDARVLAQELATTRMAHVSDALAHFETRRRPDARRVRREARFEARVTMLRSPRLRWLRDRIVAHTPAFEWFINRQATANA